MQQMKPEFNIFIEFILLCCDKLVFSVKHNKFITFKTTCYMFQSSPTTFQH